jgi:hypothetical protein
MSAQTQTPIASAGDAEQAIAELYATLDGLETTIAEETTRLRAGRLNAARELEEAKADLTRRYAAQSERVKAARGLIAQTLPEASQALRARHERFQSLLQTNLTVVATAYAVCEGIVRGVSGELARKHTPSTYGACGRANAPAAKTSQPLALSRTL